MQPGTSLGMGANGRKDFDKEGASIESNPGLVNETVFTHSGIFEGFKVGLSENHGQASQKEDIPGDFASIIGEYNSAHSSKKELKTIFQRCCQLESAASSIKWRLRQPKPIRLVNESIDRYNPLKSASKSDVLAGTAKQNIEGFCRSREGKRLYRKVCENNFYTIENFT